MFISVPWFERELTRAWIQRDEKKLVGLSGLAGVGEAEKHLIAGLLFSLSGRVLSALGEYSKAKAGLDSRGLYWLLRVDSKYCEARAQGQTMTISWNATRDLFWGVVFETRGELRRHLLHHLFFLLYFIHFWNNQVQAFLVSCGLWFYGFLAREPEARAHRKYHAGHLLVIMGRKKIGIPIVLSAYPEILAVTRPWLRHVIFSYMSYSLLTVSKHTDVIEEMLEHGDKAISDNTDPYYIMMFLVTKLRFVTQQGNVHASEATAAKLIELCQRIKNPKFFFVTKSDLAYCYGIRGIVWRCEEVLQEIENYQPSDTDSPAAGSFYRQRGWAYFLVGKYREAKRDAGTSLAYYRRSKSFWFFAQSAKLLEIASQFRLELAEENSPDRLRHCINTHIRRMARLKRKYRDNDFLFRMVSEELNSVSSLLRRVSRAAYSRDINVFNCQEELFRGLNAILDETSNEGLWATLSVPLEKALRLRFVSATDRGIKASLGVRAAHMGTQVLEFGVERRDREHPRFETVQFQNIDGSTLLPAQIDGLYTLYPMLSCLVTIHDLQKGLLQKAKSVAIANTARQVAHDVRSPLTALEMAVSTLEMPESTRILVRTAMGRINDIANNLLTSHAGKPTEKIFDAQKELVAPSHDARNIELIPHILNSIVSEKRVQYRSRLNVEISARIASESYGSFVRINAIEFRRVLSNLIDNAADSVREGGTIEVSVERTDSHAVVTVVDTGCGISSELLPTLGHKEISLKPGGHGLGLVHARRVIEEAQGILEIQSSLGLGTRIALRLPLTPAPFWFVESIQVRDHTTILVIDDDASIHHVWEKRLRKCLDEVPGASLLHFSTVAEARGWITGNRHKDFFCLVDYEFLGEPHSGLDLIEQLRLHDRSVLVTSQFDVSKVRARCEALQMKVLPKSLAIFVPVCPAPGTQPPAAKADLRR